MGQEWGGLLVVGLVIAVGSTVGQSPSFGTDFAYSVEVRFDSDPQVYLILSHFTHGERFG